MCTARSQRSGSAIREHSRDRPNVGDRGGVPMGLVKRQLLPVAGKARCS